MIGLDLAISIGGGGAAPWTPASLPSLLAWWRADLGRTGSPVTNLANQSGSGDTNRNLVIPAAGVGPNIVSADADFGGHDSLDFNGAGVNAILDSPGAWSGGLAQPFTVMAVVKRTAARAVNYHWDARTGNSPFQSAHYIKADTTTAAVFAGTELTLAAAGEASASVARGYYNGASSEISVNKKSASATGNAGTQVVSGLCIGNYQGRGFPAGKWAEQWVVSGTIAAGDETLIAAYVLARYGISMAA